MAPDETEKAVQLRLRSIEAYYGDAEHHAAVRRAADLVDLDSRVSGEKLTDRERAISLKAASYALVAMRDLVDDH